jgi:hypothetical protein
MEPRLTWVIIASALGQAEIGFFGAGPGRGDPARSVPGALHRRAALSPVGTAADVPEILEIPRARQVVCTQDRIAVAHFDLPHFLKPNAPQDPVPGALSDGQ